MGPRPPLCCACAQLQAAGCPPAPRHLLERMCLSVLREGQSCLGLSSGTLASCLSSASCLPAASYEPPKEGALGCPRFHPAGLQLHGGWRRGASLGHWLGHRLCSGPLTNHLLPCLHFCPEWEQLGGTPQPPQKTCLQAEG